MALTTYRKADNITQLNLPASWDGGVVPPTANTSRARWDSLITAARSAVLGGSTTWGQISVTNPGGLCTIAATTGATLSLNATDVDAAGVGIDMSAATQNFTIAALVGLDSSQEWRVASGRTLTVSGVITGNGRNVTLTGPGSFSITGGNTTSWINSVITVSGGTYWNIANANGPGAATNSIVVSSGSSASTGVAILPASITLSGIGTGAASARFAFWANVAQGSGRTFTFTGSRTMFLSMQSTSALTTHASKFTGTTTAETVFVAGFNTILSNTANDFVAGGNGVELQSYQTNGSQDGRWAIILSGDGSDSATFGNASNPVYIETTGSFRTDSALVNRTISRNFKIEGHTTTGASPPAPDVNNNSATKLTLSGTVNLLGTGGLPSTFDSATGGSVALAGTLTGAGRISVLAGGTFELSPGLVVSGYTGGVDVAAATIKYGVGGITGSATFANSAVLDSVSPSPVTLSHSSYTFGSPITFTGTAGSLSLGPGSVSGAMNSIVVSGSKLIIPGNITTSAAPTKSGAGTLALSGSNSFPSVFIHDAGGLELNSAGAMGSTNLLTINSGTLDSSGATLSRTGANNLNGDFTWGGTADLSMGTGALTWNAARTINFLNGKTGTLKYDGSVTTAVTPTSTLSIGGSPVGGSRSRLWLVGSNNMQATTSSITAGYFRVSDAGGLGNASTTMWTVSSGAALELIGSISPPDTRSATITGPGPFTDGALRSVSGTNVWSGSIVVPVQSLASPTRIQVDNGTFTLGASLYTTINPSTTGTPLQFTALSSGARLNQPRRLTSNVSNVIVNNGGAGTVELSVANNHTGSTTVQGGKCRVTNVTATSTGTVQVDATATLESTVQSQFTTLRLGTSGSGARAVLAFAA